MNLKRVGHLLGFELRRIRLLLFAAWIFLAMAFVPRVLDALGIWNLEWHDAQEFLAIGGGVGFGVTGLFLAVWSGLMGRKLFPGRPVLGREIGLVSWGVLLLALVVPVLGLTLVSLWLYGFSGEVVWLGVGMTALAVVPLWLGVRLFAKYAGSLKMTMVGLVVVGCLMIAGDSFGFKQLMEPWANVLGSWPGGYRWVATLVAVMLMGAAWLLAKRWGVLPRLSVAILSVVIGWGAMLWLVSEREMMTFKNELSEKVRLKRKGWGFGRSRTGVVTYDFSGERSSEVMVWEVLGSLKDEKERVYKRGRANFKVVSAHRLGRAGMNAITMGLLDEGSIYLDSSSSLGRKVDRAIQNESFRRVELRLPEGYSAGEVVRLSGRLAGKRCVVDTLVKDLPYGESAEFRRADVVGKMRWRGGDYKGDPKKMEVVVRAPLSVGGFGGRWEELRDENWLFHLSYPKAGVVLEGESGWSGGDEEVGGVRQWTERYEFLHSDLRHYDLKDETPVVSIYRIRVVEAGYAIVDSDPLILVEKERGAKSSDYWSILYGARKGTGQMPTNEWMKRPDPETASREEVGAWFREISDRNGYAGRHRDLEQYAERWGDLFWKTMEKAGERSRIGPLSFIKGAGNDWREVAIEELDGPISSASTLVERAWDEAARGKVKQLIQGGNREPELLRLGISLGLEGIEDAVVESLVVSDSWSLYEAARTRLQIEERIEAILDERLARADEVSRRTWSVNRDDYRFTSIPWLWLLHEGRKKDLEHCLGWIRKAQEGGNYSDWDGSYQEQSRFESVLFDYKKFKELEKAGNLRAEFFDWDPVLRRWIYNEKGDSK